jgi:hypothetical protein
MRFGLQCINNKKGIEFIQENLPKNANQNYFLGVDCYQLTLGFG